MCVCVFFFLVTLTLFGKVSYNTHPILLGIILWLTVAKPKVNNIRIISMIVLIIILIIAIMILILNGTWKIVV